jgi:putative phosphoesterase
MNFPIQIGILSDTHSYIHPDIVSLFSQCDIVVHAGDIIDEKTLSLLTPKQGIVAVQGNNDAHLIQLKTTELLDLPGGTLVVNHGHMYGNRQPSHNSLREAHPNAKMIVYGHTHKQLIEQDISPWVVNPGAAGATRNQGSSKCLLLTIQSAQNWRIEPYDFSEL